jgi:hypothetical protein
VTKLFLVLLVVLVVLGLLKDASSSQAPLEIFVDCLISLVKRLSGVRNTVDYCGRYQ